MSVRGHAFVQFESEPVKTGASVDIGTTAGRVFDMKFERRRSIMMVERGPIDASHSPRNAVLSMARLHLVVRAINVDKILRCTAPPSVT